MTAEHPLTRANRKHFPLLPAAVAVAVAAAVLTGCGNTAPGSAPAACLAALDKAEEFQAVLINGIDLAAQGFDAVSNLDAAELGRVTSEIEDATPKVGAAKAAYTAAAAECRGESR